MGSVLDACDPATMRFTGEAEHPILAPHRQLLPEKMHS
jgi:hypothetical protein